jgi:hypothetical protein
MAVNTSSDLKENNEKVDAQTVQAQQFSFITRTTLYARYSYELKLRTV